VNSEIGDAEIQQVASLGAFENIVNLSYRISILLTEATLAAIAKQRSAIEQQMPFAPGSPEDESRFADSESVSPE
jgi:hypothetical protein